MFWPPQVPGPLSSIHDVTLARSRISFNPPGFRHSTSAPVNLIRAGIVGSPLVGPTLPTYGLTEHWHPTDLGLPPEEYYRWT